MNPQLNISFANPDPNAVVVSLTDLIALLDVLVSGEIEGSYTPYVRGDSTPSVDDQDKAWHRTDAAGRPLGTFLFYNGSWRREYTGLPHQIRMFNGDPAQWFDNDGLGLPNLEWDGWQLCNGKNTSPNLSNLFIIGGRMDNVGITGYTTSGTSNLDTIPDGTGWQTNTGNIQPALLAGGAAAYALVNTNLPKMDIQLTGKGNYDETQSRENKAIVTGRWSGAGDKTVDVDSFGSSPVAPIPTLPPFYALAFVTWVGYA